MENDLFEHPCQYCVPSPDIGILSPIDGIAQNTSEIPPAFTRDIGKRHCATNLHISLNVQEKCKGWAMPMAATYGCPCG